MDKTFLKEFIIDRCKNNIDLNRKTDMYTMIKSASEYKRVYSKTESSLELSNAGINLLVNVDRTFCEILFSREKFKFRYMSPDENIPILFVSKEIEIHINDFNYKFLYSFADEILTFFKVEDFAVVPKKHCELSEKLIRQILKEDILNKDGKGFYDNVAYYYMRIANVFSRVVEYEEDMDFETMSIYFNDVSLNKLKSKDLNFRF